ncbi:uncharacterized protein F5891DRAFT_984522 [Suillus fuscotomentosus]|uniref:Uncharacterized protein n=1 Tax=Suillus fuscotomentosus TaxID=1912939 RepID=A0AAD4DYP8_9AGAM|nr:uncharacterized protein F5891DRAFT_984522 [Suillus fuscotomentosus]KAG1895068.1 hypothetical protein F5891DRAFT_984522 [Suillus fuscotomentosus]
MLSSSPVLSAYYIANNLGPDSGHCDLMMLEASQADGQSHLLTKPRSMPQDNITSSHANHHYMDRKRMVTEPMDPNQHLFEGPLQNESPLHNDTNDIDSSSLPPGLPPRDKADISLMDIQQGEEIFKCGIQSMPDTTVRSAVAAKRADTESKRLRALAAAWELEAAEKHAVLLQTILRDYSRQYVKSREEACFFERLMMVGRNRHQLEDDTDFTIAAYSHDLVAFNIAAVQLNYLEMTVAEQDLSLEDYDPGDAEYCFRECIDSVVRESRCSASPMSEALA